MQKLIKPSRNFNNNRYLRRKELQKHINWLRDVLGYQKFSNEVIFSFRDLIYSINYYKKELNKTLKEIEKIEQGSFPFGT